MAQAQAAQMFHEADTDGDGIVSLEEFAIAWANDETARVQEEARRKAQEIDKAVREALAMQMFPAYSSLKGTFDSYDTSRQGFITYDQFAQVNRQRLF